MVSPHSTDGTRCGHFWPIYARRCLSPAPAPSFPQHSFVHLRYPVVRNTYIPVPRWPTASPPYHRSPTTRNKEIITPREQISFECFQHTGRSFISEHTLLAFIYLHIAKCIETFIFLSFSLFGSFKTPLFSSSLQTQAQPLQFFHSQHKLCLLKATM